VVIARFILLQVLAHLQYLLFHKLRQKTQFLIWYSLVAVALAVMVVVAELVDIEKLKPL